MSQYYVPTKVFWGKDCLLNAGNQIAGFGQKPLLVTGRKSAQLSGALPDLLSLLQHRGMTYHLFSDIGENPELEIVHKGAAELREHNCDFVIGIGGGSPIDAAKAISVIAANDLTGREIYDPEKIKKALPIIAIPTTSGTGTEVTPFSVISDQQIQKKAGFGNPLIFPALALCDPRYTCSLPTKVTIDTAIDALSHLLEGIYSRKRCDLLFPIIFTGIKDIILYLEKVLREPTNFHYRVKLMTSSLYGGMVIAQSSTTLQHSIGYPLTTHYGLSHGMANGIVIENIMELYSDALTSELDSLFKFLEITREEFYLWLQKWTSGLKLNLPGEFIDRATEEIMGSRNMTQNPRDISSEEIKKILKKL